MGQSQTVRALHELIRTNCPSMVFLSKTRMESCRLELLKEQMGFHSSFYVDPRGSSGRLCLWWTEEVQVHVLGYSINLVHTLVTLKQVGTSFRGSWFYGLPVFNMHSAFWIAMSRMDWKDGRPWLCIGSRQRFLFDFMTVNSLMDLGFKGQKFTWCCFREGKVYLQEHLDRALRNAEWVQKWPDSLVLHGAHLGSDHCPLLLHLSHPTHRAPPPFRFESYWADDVECERIIKHAWQRTV